MAHLLCKLRLNSVVDVIENFRASDRHVYRKIGGFVLLLRDEMTSLA